MGSQIAVLVELFHHNEPVVAVLSFNQALIVLHGLPLFIILESIEVAKSLYHMIFKSDQDGAKAVATTKGLNQACSSATCVVLRSHGGCSPFYLVDPDPNVLMFIVCGAESMHTNGHNYIKVELHGL